MKMDYGYQLALVDRLLYLEPSAHSFTVRPKPRRHLIRSALAAWLDSSLIESALLSLNKFYMTYPMKADLLLI